MKIISDFVKLQGSCVLGVSLIVDQTNAEHVYEIGQLLGESGVHNVKISPFIVSNDEAKTIFITNQFFPQYGFK